MEDLAEKFHALGGESIGEHKKLFNAFARELIGVGAEQVSQFINGLVARNRQERIFRVRLLLLYGTSADWMRELMDGDRISAKIIIKRVNIIDLFHGISGDAFIRNICPHISYVVRVRLINILAPNINDESTGEEFYRAVSKKYGSKIATPFLACCSLKFIRQIAISHKINFTDRNLIRIYKKFRGFLPFYFKELSKYECDCFKKRELLARFLALKDADTFWALTKYGFPKIGKRGKMHIIKVFKNEVINNPKKFENFAKPKLIKRCINRKEYKILFMNSFPKSTDDINFFGNFGECLEGFPIKQRYDNLCIGYKETYKHDFNSNDFQMNLNMFSIEDQRRIEKNLETYNLDSIKRKIADAHDIDERSKLLIKLLETCRLYDDYDGLLDVLKYFLTRHKNESTEVRKSFFGALDQKFFKKEKYKEEHWDVLFQLLNIFDMDGENYYDKCYFLAGFIEYKARLGLDYSKELKECFGIAGIYNLEMFHDNIAYDCYTQLAEFLEEIFADDIENALVQYIFTVQDWNKKHGNKRIGIYKFPKLLQRCMKVPHQHNHYFFYLLFNEILHFVPINEEEKTLKRDTLDQFFEKQLEHFQLPMLMWFFKHDLEIVSKRLDTFLENAGASFYYEVSKMHYHPLYEECKKRALDGLNGNAKEKCWAMKFLSYEDDYLELIEEYRVNEEASVNLLDEKEKELAEIRKSILKSLKNYSRPEKCLNYLLCFCRRDYLRYALEPLYFILNNTREELIEAPICELLTRAVSVRKHTIYLGSTLLSIEFTKNLITEMVKTEENKSVCQFLLRRTLTCLRDEGQLEFWQLLKIQVQSLQGADYSTIDAMMIFKMLPQKYIGEYIQLIWEHLSSSESNQKMNMLKKIEKPMYDHLSLELYKDVLDTIGFVTIYNEFVCDFLLSNCSSLDERLEITFCCIEKVVEVDFETIMKEPVVKKLYEFVETLVKKIIEDKPKSALAFLEAFIDNLNTLSTPFPKVEFLLLLDLTVKYISKPENLATELIVIQGEIILKCGSAALHYYRSIIKKFLDIVYNTLPDDNSFYYLSLCEELSWMSSSDDAYLLIIDLVPLKASKDVSFNRRRDEVIKLCADFDSDIVKMHLARYLINLCYR